MQHDVTAAGVHSGPGESFPRRPLTEDASSTQEGMGSMNTNDTREVRPTIDDLRLRRTRLEGHLNSAPSECWDGLQEALAAVVAEIKERENHECPTCGTADPYQCECGDPDIDGSDTGDEGWLVEDHIAHHGR